MDRPGFDLPEEIPPPPENPSPASTRRSRWKPLFIWGLLIAMFLLVVQGNVVETLAPEQRGGAGSGSSAASTVDLQILAIYATPRSLTPPAQLESNLQQLLKSARPDERSAILRRIAVVQHDLQLPGLPTTLRDLRAESQALASKITTMERVQKGKTADEELTQLRGQKQFSDQIIQLYSSKKIDRKTADAMNRTVREKWDRLPELLALKHIYQKSGQTQLAAQTDARINQLVSRSSSLLVLAMFAGLGLFLVGCVLLLGYFVFVFMRKKPLAMPLADQPVERADSLAGAFNVYFILYFFGSVLFAVVLGPLMRGISGLGMEGRLAANLAISTFWVVLGYLWLSRFAGGTGFRRQEVGLRTENWALDIGWGVAGYLASLPLLAIGVFISTKIVESLPANPNPAGTIAMNSETVAAKLLILTMAAGFAPIAEEIFFRGALFAALWRRLGRMLPALLISAVIFALIHPQFLGGAVVITIIGSVYALLYAERRSLLPCMVAHALNNGVITTALFIFN